MERLVGIGDAAQALGGSRQAECGAHGGRPSSPQPNEAAPGGVPRPRRGESALGRLRSRVEPRSKGCPGDRYGVQRPRPECFWPVEALELAEGLIGEDFKFCLRDSPVDVGFDNVKPGRQLSDIFGELPPGYNLHPTPAFWVIVALIKRIFWSTRQAWVRA